MQSHPAHPLRLLVLLGGLLALVGSAHAVNPTISIPVSTQTINENTSGAPLSVIVGDAETPAANLVLSVFSTSNSGLIPTGSVTLGGNGANRTVSVTPLANRNGIATITLRVTDGANDTTNASFTVTVTPVNVAPTISGGAVASISDNVAAPVALFAGSLAVADADHGQPSPTQPGSETLTVTLTIDEDDRGLGQFNEFTLGTIGSVTVVSSGGAQVTVSGNPPDLTTFLRTQVTFTPIANGTPVGAPLPVLNIAVVASDGGEDGVSPATRALAVNYVSVNDPPTGSVSTAGLVAFEGAPIAPFGNFTASDPDAGERIRVAIAVTPSGNGSFPAGSLPFTGTPAQVETYVRALQFTPGTANAAFVFTLTDVHPDDSVGTPVTLPSTSLTVMEVNGNPQIAGITTTLIRTAEGVPTALFPNVSVVDPDGDPLTVSIGFPVANGTFPPPPAPFTLTGGSYVYAAPTAAAATTALRALLFTPSQLAGGEVFGFTLTLTDGKGGTATDSRTRLEVTSVDNSPVIAGLPSTTPNSPLPISPSGDVKPFAGATISDDSPTLTVTVTLDDPAKGTLVNGSDVPPLFSPSGSGYLFIGSPAAATTALTGLIFVPSTTYPFPPAAPGGTTFSIVANDGVTSPGTRSLSIVLLSNRRNHLVTKTDDVPVPPVWAPGATYAPGSQVVYVGNVYSRIAPGNEAPFNPAMWSDAADAEGTLRVAVALAGDNDTITFALPQYPATIRLTQKLVIPGNLNFRGPGADKLTLSGDSDGNLTPDTQLFDIRATVTMEGLGLSRGLADLGGAISVSGTGDLTLRHCAITDSRASRWGGAIDVDGGKLRLENCLLRGNRTDGVLGRGGGAVSLYTSKPCEFVNCTFGGNVQGSASGVGGGAVYTETISAADGLEVTFTHCTFSENADAASAGTSVQANGFGTAVKMRNCIVGDGAGGNLEVLGSAAISSLGGNLSDDLTRVTLVQGGVPKLVFAFNEPSDQTAINPLLGSLGLTVGPTPTYPLAPASPAIASAVGTAAGTDGRGVLRMDGGPDSGAFEAGSPKRLVLNEIRFSAPNPAFLEFYNPRDSQPLDLTGAQLLIDGTPVHTFTAPLPFPPIQPGFGFIVAASNTVNGNGSPVVVPASLLLTDRGLVEVQQSAAAGGGTLLSAAYNGKFAASLDPSMDYNLAGASITLAPQFVGAAYVPHPLVPGGAGAASSPGRDTNNTAFGANNAEPQAFDDQFLISEDESDVLDVLANDFDADGADRLVIVDVTGSNAAGANDATATSARGATVVIEPANNGSPGTPHRGLEIRYDPRASSELQSLPEGQEAIDSFTYTIVDLTTGSAESFATAPGAPTKTLVTSPAHRLADTDRRIRISGSGTYDGVWLAELIDLSPPSGNFDKDRFLIPTAFTAAATGTWETVDPRPIPAFTQRDTATVTVKVLGANDPPTPVDDVVATDETRVLRVMADSTLAGTLTAFDTDPSYPQPRSISSTSLLLLDTDPDTDDSGESLRVVGVVRDVAAIGGYSRAPGNNATTVDAPAHGLETNATVLIAGYGGHPSYNGVHTVTVLGPNRFNIPVSFVDNHPTPGVFTRYNPGAQLSTTSEHGAQVALEIRADHRETNIVYNPRPSAFLDGIPAGSSETDSFYYAVRDSHGALGLAKVTVNVAGVNDAPVPGNDPSTLVSLAPLLGGVPAGNLPALGNALGKLDIAYLLPPSDDSPDRARVGVIDPANPGAGLAEVDLLWFTDEETPLTFNIDPATSGPFDLLGNDSDVDRGDVLRIGSPGTVYLSREGATATVSGDGRSLVYDPRASSQLNALARGERIIDTFIVTVRDIPGAGVDSLVAVMVVGINDTPTAVADTGPFSTPEDQLLLLGPPGVLANDIEPDQNISLPDNRRMLVPGSGLTTGVGGVVYSLVSERASGVVSGFLQDPGNPLQTIVNAPGHPLVPGEEVVIRNTGVPDYEGQFVIVAADALAGTFTVARAFVNGSALAVGEWSSVRGSILYDPRSSTAGTGPLLPNGLNGLAVGQSFIDTITYEIFDGSFVFAMDDLFKVAADAPAADLDVLANDRNLTGVTTTLALVDVGPPSRGGSAQIATTSGGATVIRYVPQAGFFGDEAFTYSIEDELGNRDTAQVTVRATINTLNGNLQANDDAFTVALGQVPVLAVLANDNIIPAGAGSLVVAGTPVLPAKGTVQVVAGGIAYTPNAGASGMDQFTYEISGGGTARATATVDVEIVDLTDKLFTRDDAFSVLVGSSANPLDVLANDNILPGNGLALGVDFTGVPADLPTHGTLAVNPDGNGFTYTPASGFVGVDRFRYAASDGYGSTGTADVTVTVGSLVTNGDFFVLPATANGVALPVLANDQVLASPGGSVSIVGMAATAAGAPSSALSLGTLGSLALVGGEIRFTAAGALGEATFFYTIEDPSGRRAVGEASVAVIADGVSANPDFFSLLRDSGPTDLHVLFNDSAIPVRQLALVSIGTGLSAPDRGGFAQIVDTPAGPRVRYQPAPGFVGVETFTYTITDSIRNDTSTVVVNVGLGDLHANDDAYSVFYALSGSSPGSFTLPVLFNDAVLPNGGEELTITGVGIDQTGEPNAPDMQGLVEISPDGTSLVYTPAANPALLPGDTFAERFTYVISDGTDRRAEAQVLVNVSVRDEARAMETRDDAFTVAADSLANRLDVLANDGVKPAPASGWTITGVTAPQLFPTDPDPADANDGGVASVSGGAILYSPRAGFVGLVSFSYSVSDGLGGTGSADVLLKVGDVGVCADRFTVLSGSTGNVFDVTANDGLLPEGFPTRPDGSPLPGFTLDPALAAAPDRGGSASVANGNIVYQPAPGFVGTERFAYWVIDDSGNRYPGDVVVFVELAGSDRSTTTAQITITGVNDLPVIGGTSTFTITDKQVITPFGGATLTDVDDQGMEALTLTLSLGDPSRGILYHPGGLFTRFGNNYVSLPMSPSDATAALRGLQFQPTPDGRVSPGTTESVTISLSVHDGHATVSDEETVVTTQHPPQSKILPLGTATGADDSQTNAEFGSAVSVSGDTMAVGSWLRDTAGGVDSGAVFIYRRVTSNGADQWQQTKVVLAADGTAADRFGISVALDGDTLVVGASGDAPGGFTTAGAAYVFDRNTGGADNWGQVRKLVVETPGRAAGDEFGHDVDIDGDTIIVGAPFATRGAGDSGMARVYERDLGGAGNWGLRQEIIQLDPIFLDWFGVSVAVSGNSLIVGAHGANRQQNAANFDLGAAYIFDRTGPVATPWQQVKKLDRFADPRSARDDYFGWAVDISGDTAIVGTFLYDSVPGAPNSGAAFLYQRHTGGAGNWGQLLELRAPAPMTDERLGFSVALDGGMALVGTESRSVGTGAGFVQCYVRDLGTDNWRFTDTIRPPDLTVRPRFGVGVAVDAFTVAVGASHDRANPLNRVNAGAVYAAQLQLSNANAFALFVRDWQIANFSAAIVQNPAAEAGVWGLGADPDADGLTNGSELLMGTDPNQPNPQDAIRLVPAPGGYALLYRRSKSFPAEFAHPVWSTDLRAWNRTGFVESVDADLGTSERIRAYLASGGALNIFLRIDIGPP